MAVGPSTTAATEPSTTTAIEPSTTAATEASSTTVAIEPLTSRDESLDFDDADYEPHSPLNLDFVNEWNPDQQLHMNIDDVVPNTTATTENDTTTETSAIHEVITGTADSALWTEESVEAMLWLIKDMKAQYEKPGSGYKARLWTETKKALEIKGYVRTTKQIQNKFGSIKNRWRDREWLLKQSGFGIDPDTKRVTAPSPCWEALRTVRFISLVIHSISL